MNRALRPYFNIIILADLLNASNETSGRSGEDLNPLIRKFDGWILFRHVRKNTGFGDLGTKCTQFWTSKTLCYSNFKRFCMLQLL